MVRSLISQLYYKCEGKQLDSLFSSCEDGRRQPTCESLCRAFLDIIEQVKEVWIILDALDECRTRKGPRIERITLVDKISPKLGARERPSPCDKSARTRYQIRSKRMGS
jgi:hypothetical protein